MPTRALVEALVNSRDSATLSRVRTYPTRDEWGTLPINSKAQHVSSKGSAPGPRHRSRMGQTA